MSKISLLDYLGVHEDKFEWMMLASCRIPSDTDKTFIKETGDLFFDTYEEGGDSARNVDEVCRSCPVRDACLASGIEDRRWGVWGGVYLDGSGKPDVDRNAHKTRADWEEIDKIYPLSDATWAKIEKRLSRG